MPVGLVHPVGFIHSEPKTFLTQHILARIKSITCNPAMECGRRCYDHSIYLPVFKHTAIVTINLCVGHNFQSLLDRRRICVTYGGDCCGRDIAQEA